MQVPLQPSFTCLWLKPHTSINELSIGKAVSWWPLIQTGKDKLSLPQMGALQGKKTVSQPVCAKEAKNGPPSANQGLSNAEPRHDHDVCTLWVHPPTSPCPTNSAHTEPNSKGHCQKWYHNIKVSYRHMVSSVSVDDTEGAKFLNEHHDAHKQSLLFTSRQK